jgi:hypothetical protein
LQLPHLPWFRCFPGITLYQGMFYGGDHIQNAVILALALAGGLTIGEYLATTLRSMRTTGPRRR